jgi:hypothetical protein
LLQDPASGAPKELGLPYSILQSQCYSELCAFKIIFANFFQDLFVQDHFQAISTLSGGVSYRPGSRRNSVSAQQQVDQFPLPIKTLVV